MTFSQETDSKINMMSARARAKSYLEDFVLRKNSVFPKEGVY